MKPMSSDEVDSKLRKKRVESAMMFVIAWIIFNFIYFWFFALISVSLLTDMWGFISYRWEAYLIGFVIGLTICKGFFPIGMANGMIKAHWMYIENYRNSLSSKASPATINED